MLQLEASDWLQGPQAGPSSRSHSSFPPPKSGSDGAPAPLAAKPLCHLQLHAQSTGCSTSLAPLANSH
jgi:hypothetical protein